MSNLLIIVSEVDLYLISHPFTVLRVFGGQVNLVDPLDRPF